MALTMKQKIGFFIGIFSIVLIAIFFIMMFARNKDQTVPKISEMSGDGVDGFTFFNIGANTVLTESLRETLSNKLGSETVVKRSTIDLSMNYREFLQQYSMELNELNLALNDSAGARIEHNAITFTYRYPPMDKSDFDFVRLIFSNYSQKPLFFIIKSDKEGSAILTVLTAKYGEPEFHNWQNHQGVSYHWQKGNDVLILSQSVNRIGNPEFNIHIYFIDNIKELILTEKQEALKREQERKQIDRQAF